MILFYDVLSLKFTEADHSLPCGCWFRQGYFVLGKGILVFQGQEVHDMFHLCVFLLTLTSIVRLLSRLFILGKIWVGIKLDSRKVHHLYPTILQEFLFVDRDFAVGGIHPWVTVMVAITLIVIHIQDLTYGNSKWYWGMSHWYSNKMIFSDQGRWSWYTILWKIILLDVNTNLIRQLSIMRHEYSVWVWRCFLW